MTILNRFSVILLYCESTQFLASRRGISGNSGPRFWESCDLRICATKFWRVCFFSAPFRFALKTPQCLKGTEKKWALQKHPFGGPFLHTTPSPLLWRALNDQSPLRNLSLTLHGTRSTHVGYGFMLGTVGRSPHEWLVYGSRSSSLSLSLYLSISLYISLFLLLLSSPSRSLP